MTKNAFILVRLTCLAAFHTQTAFAEDPRGYFTEPQQLESEEFQGLFARVGPGVYMAGQPTEMALHNVKKLGVTTVINLRTQVEMDNRAMVAFDEAETVRGLDMDYVHIPAGGPDTPYAPQMVDRFAQALHAASGDVLLHCTVAWRASHLWTAYLVKYHGLSLQQAVAISRKLNFGDIPLEGFLGESLTVTPLSKQVNDE